MATDCETRLAEARAALHNLMTGTKVVELRNGDQTMRYESTNRNVLADYIRQLEAECGSTPCANRRRPIGVAF